MEKEGRKGGRKTQLHVRDGKQASFDRGESKKSKLTCDISPNWFKYVQTRMRNWVRRDTFGRFRFRLEFGRSSREKVKSCLYDVDIDLRSKRTFYRTNTLQRPNQIVWRYHLVFRLMLQILTSIVARHDIRHTLVHTA